MRVTAPAAGRLFTPNFLLLWISSFFAFTSFHMLLPILPLYVVNIGGTESQVGLTIGILAVTSVAVRTWVGRESDQKGKKLLLVWGSIALVASAFSYTLASTVLLLLSLRLFHGVAWAATTTPSPALVADISPSDRRGEAMGWFGTASSLAMAMAPLAAVSLNAAYGFTSTFLIASSASVIALVTVVWIREPDYGPARPKTKDPASRGGFPWQAIIYPPAIVPSIAMLVVTLTYGSMMSFVPLLAARHDVNPGIFFAVFAISLVLARPFGGKVSDGIGHLAAVIPGVVAIAFSMGLLAFATQLPSFLIGAVFYGVGFAFVNPSLMAMAADRATPETRGAAMGTFSAAYDMGIGLGAIVLGLLLEKTSFQFLFLTCAAISIVSILTFAFDRTRLE